MRVLVTGGAGFIGSHVVGALLERGARVRVLDDFSTGKREHLSSDIELIEGSITSAQIARDAMRDCDAVFHLAAIASVQKSVEQPVSTGRVNVEGTVNLLEAAAQAGAKVILSSSAAVYGNSEKLPVEELDLPETLSPYAVQKLGSEGYLRAFHATHGLRCVSLRYFNVYGPRQDPNSEYAAVVPKFVTRAIEGRTLVIYGDGGQTRDFVFVEDVARANILALESDVEDGRPINIGSGKSVSVLELAHRVVENTGSSSEIEHQPARLGEVRRSECSVEAARQRLGFEAEVDLEEGLRRTADYWRLRAPA